MNIGSLTRNILGLKKYHLKRCLLIRFKTDYAFNRFEKSIKIGVATQSDE
jgi:hypothetical protein